MSARTWTVIGFWDGDEAVPVGVVAGEHQVTGGDGCSTEGPWATSVQAPNAAGAEAAAVAEMEG